ncbi:MAG: hypothetical protein KGZ88_11835 [Methylomicrobium sp.]|nr:hypothetical protein [Methylomicrobium sp.]
MNIDSLKAKLDDATFTSLKDHVETLERQRDDAKKESIDGRKGMKARIAELESQQSQLLEKLGVDSVEDIDALPDSKGQAEAVKQFETKLNRLQKQLTDKDAELNEVAGKYKQSQLESHLQKSLSSHDFIDRDLVAHYAKSKIEWDGDEPLFKTDDGKLIKLTDGVTLLAKEKPHLVKSQGAGGSGYGQSGASGHSQKNPFSKESFNLTEQIQLKKENPTLAEQLKAAASQ